MSDTNRISASLTPAKIAAVKAAVATIRENLDFLVSLTNQERQVLPKMNDKSMGFDAKCAAYMQSNPEFIPAYVDVNEVVKDRELRDGIREVLSGIASLARDADSTDMLVNSEIWMADLYYYNNVKIAAKRGVPDAEPIYDDLSVRFPGFKKPKAP